MLPVNCGSHADYQHFVVTNFRKYYPDPDALARSTWDIIERFWNLDLSFTDTFIPTYSNICLHSGEKKKTADGQRISCAFLYH